MNVDPSSGQTTGYNSLPEQAANSANAPAKAIGRVVARLNGFRESVNSSKNNIVRNNVSIPERNVDLSLFKPTEPATGWWKYLPSLGYEHPPEDRIKPVAKQYSQLFQAQGELVDQCKKLRDLTKTAISDLAEITSDESDKSEEAQQLRKGLNVLNEKVAGELYDLDLEGKLTKYYSPLRELERVDRKLFMETEQFNELVEKTDDLQTKVDGLAAIKEQLKVFLTQLTAQISESTELATADFQSPVSKL